MTREPRCPCKDCLHRSKVAPPVEPVCTNLESVHYAARWWTVTACTKRLTAEIMIDPKVSGWRR